jgi:hypothetical protein
LQTEIDAQDAEYTSLRNPPDALCGEMWDKLKRV